MNNYRSLFVAFFCCLLTQPSLVVATDSHSTLSAYERYVQEQKQGFTRYKEEHRKFVSQLQKEWQDYKKMQALVRDQMPKLPTAPVRRGSRVRPVEQAPAPVGMIIPNKTPIFEPYSNPTTSIVEEPKPIIDPILTTPKADTPKEGLSATNPTAAVPRVKDTNSVQTYSFDFYGQKVTLPTLPDVQLKGTTEKDLQQYWALSAKADYEPILKDIDELKRTLVLSDWAVFLLTQAYIKQQLQDQRQVIASSWFLLNNLGYEARIASGDTSLILLMTSQQTLFGMPYFPIKEKRYYQFLGEASKNIRSYAGEFSKKNKPLDMSFSKTLKTGADIQYRQVTTTIGGDSVTLDIPYDLQLIHYFATYPQLDLRYYFEASVDPITAKSLQRQIPALLIGSKDNKASQLLHFIHESFPYAVDHQQFGHENYLTVEESLHYQASDCEDRSVLFAWLAKHLLREPVVALSYEGHVATALTRRGRLVSADPTYIGANLGDIMPDFTGIRPKVIRF